MLTETSEAGIDLHKHRWIIGSQGAASSIGTCDCGEQKDFANGWQPRPNPLYRQRVPNKSR